VERLQPADLKQIATVEAIFVYNAAQRDQMLPRKPLPQPDLEQKKRAPIEGIFPGAVPRQSTTRCSAAWKPDTVRSGLGPVQVRSKSAPGASRAGRILSSAFLCAFSISPAPPRHAGFWYTDRSAFKG